MDTLELRELDEHDIAMVNGGNLGPNYIGGLAPGGSSDRTGHMLGDFLHGFYDGIKSIWQ